MKGFKLQYGIWNFEHSITSRDVGMPEIHKTKIDINNVLRDKEIDYRSMGYELWFTKKTKVDVVLCECGKYCEVGLPCWYCGNERIGINTKLTDSLLEAKEVIKSV